MADHKHYVSLGQQDGSIMISEDVIASIAAKAIKEVEGVVDLYAKLSTDIIDILGKKNWNKGIRVLISENNALTIYCNVIVAYGQDIMAVAKAIQTSVTGSVEATTGVQVRMVNVNICEIVRK